MAVETRRYTPSDAPQLAAFLRRNGYGPASQGRDLDTGALERVLRERCVTDLFLGVSNGAICGTLAFGMASGRRTCGPLERFAGLYVVDAQHRNTLLPGRLFRDAFTEVIERGGLRSLRIEANPANHRAFPLYLRAGFRALPDARPDEDGYIELVSHLPAVAEDVFAANSMLSDARRVSALSLKAMKLGRVTDPSAGVFLRDGRWVLRYPIDTGTLAIEAFVDYATGTLLSCRQLSGPPIILPEPRPLKPLAPPALLIDAEVAHGVRVLVADDGTLRLIGSQGVELLRERWPVTLGDDAPAVRRQGRPRRVRVSAHPGESLWTLRAEDDPVYRILRIEGATLHTTSVPTAAATVITSPWIRSRSGHRAVRRDGDWTVGPLVYGVWPQEWTDFEAAFPEDEVDAVWWSDGVHGVMSVWGGAGARPEAMMAPQLQGTGPGEPVTLTLTVSGPEFPRPVAGTAASLKRVISVRRRLGGTRSPLPVAAAPAAPRVTVKEATGRILLGAGSHALELAPEAGLIRWAHRDTPILTSPYPASAPLGPLVSHRVAAWCASTRRRDHDDQGFEWVDDTHALPWAGAEGIGTGWTVEPIDESTMRFSVTATQGDDVAIFATPAVRAGVPVVVQVDGKLWRIGESGLRWRAWVDQAALELASGKALLIAPVAGAETEVFLRKEPTGLLVAIVGRAGSRLVADLTALESSAQAELALGSPGGARG